MRLYADEDFPLAAVEELRRLGHDGLTAQDDGRRSTPDPDILARAHALGRVVLTHNRLHVEPLHCQGAIRMSDVDSAWSNDSTWFLQKNRIECVYVRENGPSFAPFAADRR